MGTIARVILLRCRMRASEYSRGGGGRFLGNGALGARRNAYAMSKDLLETTTSVFCSRGFFSQMNPFAASESSRADPARADVNTAARAFEHSNVRRRHSERRLVPFSPQEIHAVVADVDQYKHFVPWCIQSRILSKQSEASSSAIPGQNNGSGAEMNSAAHASSVLPPIRMQAELEVGFQLISEKYTSRIDVSEESIRVECVESNLFEHLVSEWRFKPGPEQGSAWLDFLIDFKFRNAVYQGMSNVFFEQVVKKMVEAFENRCMDLYSRTPRHTRHQGPSRRY